MLETNTVLIPKANYVELPLVGPEDLTSLADVINECHFEAGKLASRALAYAIKAGQALLAAKQLVQHGEWGKWIGEHCQVSHRVANRYMRLAEHRGELADLASEDQQLSITAAMRLLSAPVDSSCATKVEDDTPVDDLGVPAEELAAFAARLPEPGQRVLLTCQGEDGVLVGLLGSRQSPGYCYYGHVSLKTDESAISRRPVNTISRLGQAALMRHITRSVFPGRDMADVIWQPAEQCDFDETPKGDLHQPHFLTEEERLACRADKGSAGEWQQQCYISEADLFGFGAALCTA